MSDPQEPSVHELLELDIDTRLARILSDVLEHPSWLAEQVAWFCRFSYGRGYEDALTEKRRGDLLRSHGLKVPRRRK